MHNPRPVVLDVNVLISEITGRGGDRHLKNLGSYQNIPILSLTTYYVTKLRIGVKFQAIGRIGHQRGVLHRFKPHSIVLNALRVLP